MDSGVVEVFAKQGAVGFLALLAIMQVSIIMWLLRIIMASYDSCDERIGKLINNHSDFVRQTSRDLSSLLVRVEHMLDRIEKMLEKARDCADGN